MSLGGGGITILTLSEGKWELEAGRLPPLRSVGSAAEAVSSHRSWLWWAPLCRGDRPPLCTSGLTSQWMGLLALLAALPGPGERSLLFFASRQPRPFRERWSDLGCPPLSSQPVSAVPGGTLLPQEGNSPHPVPAGHIQPPPGPGRSHRLCSVPSRQGLHPGGADAARRRVLPRVSVLDVSMASLWDGGSESPHTLVESQTLGFRRGSPSICPLGVLGGLSVTSAWATGPPAGALGLSMLRGGWGRLALPQGAGSQRGQAAVTRQARGHGGP